VLCLLPGFDPLPTAAAQEVMQQQLSSKKHTTWLVLHDSGLLPVLYTAVYMLAPNMQTKTTPQHYTRQYTVVTATSSCC
jgi:hypothetical protein